MTGGNNSAESVTMLQDNGRSWIGIGKGMSSTMFTYLRYTMNELISCFKPGYEIMKEIVGPEFAQRHYNHTRLYLRVMTMKILS